MSKSAKIETSKSSKVSTPKEPAKPETKPGKRKAVDGAGDSKPKADSDTPKTAKKAKIDEEPADESAEKTSRSGRVIKPKRFGTDISTPTRNTDTDSDVSYSLVNNLSLF